MTDDPRPFIRSQMPNINEPIGVVVINGTTHNVMVSETYRRNFEAGFERQGGPDDDLRVAALNIVDVSAEINSLREELINQAAIISGLSDQIEAVREATTDAIESVSLEATAAAGVAEEAISATSPESVAGGGVSALATTIMVAGAGLTGGGSLAADRTFDVGAGAGITVNANDVAITDNANIARLNVASTFSTKQTFSANIQVGTFTTLGAETLSGFLTIEDAGGTTRKIGVIS